MKVAAASVAVAFAVAAPAQSQENAVTPPAVTPTAEQLQQQADARRQAERQKLIEVRFAQLRELQIKHNRLARKADRYAGQRVRRVKQAYVSSFDHPTEVLKANRKLRAKIRALRELIVYYKTGPGMWKRMRRDIPASGRAWLNRLGFCESGHHGEYRANTGNGFYGRYQFDRQTWYGTTQYGLPAPTALPHQSSPAEQDVRAWKVRLARGTQPWPKCG